MNKEKASKDRFYVWLLPVTYSIHIVEEYFCGQGLPVWLSEFINADISDFDFIIINSFALLIVILFASIYSFYKQYNVLYLALTSLFFINGIVHLVTSLVSNSYSPGMVTGAILYIPMGFFLYNKIKPALTRSNQKLGFLLGILIHIVVALIAYNI